MGGIHGILAPIVVDLSLERKEIVLEVCKLLSSDLPVSRKCSLYMLCLYVVFCRLPR